MAKSENQRLKLLYILKFLSEKSDAEHPLSTQQLIDLLDQEGIRAERKSIYSDISCLQEFGYEIEHSKKRSGSGYYLKKREFELGELKLLVDAVSASRFMTHATSRRLIEKLEKLAAPHEAKQLKRQVFVTDRVKNENEAGIENVDFIHRALQENKRIGFRYFEWGVDKKMHFRRNGMRYEVSPLFLVWNEENYYLVAYDGKAQLRKHYRVDKMAQIELLDEPREGLEILQSENPATYVQQKFGMFSGEEQTVTIQFPESMSGIMFDRFGKNVDIRKRGEGVYSLRVKVAVSPQFFGWLTGLSDNDDVKILGPEDVRSRYHEYLKNLCRRYDG